MPFDMGFNFRGTAGYVTDPTYAVPVLAEAYPHTYTNADGKSINAGWSGAAGVVNVDRSATNDPRIAGINYINPGNSQTFDVDLSSGSAPGAGTYTIDVAIGDHDGGGTTQSFKILDTSTLLIDGTNGGAGYALAAGHFLDATVADVPASTTWTGTTVNKSFATTLARLSLNPTAISDYDFAAHLRLTLAESGAAITPQMGAAVMAGVASSPVRGTLLRPLSYESY